MKVILQKVLLTSFFFTIFIVGKAQDRIVFTSGRSILGYDVEESDIYVKFRKKPNCFDCPKRLILRRRVSHIIKGDVLGDKELKEIIRKKSIFWIMSVNKGIAFPSINYKINAEELTNYNLAQTGTLSDVKFTYYFLEDIGISASYNVTKNKMNLLSMRKVYEDLYGGRFKISGQSPWKISSIMVGPNFHVVNLDWIIVDFGGKLGHSNIRIPEYNIRQRTKDDNVESLSESTRISSISGSFEAMVLIPFSKKFSVNIGSMYYLSNPKIKFGERNGFNQPIKIFELSGGLGLRL